MNDIFDPKKLLLSYRLEMSKYLYEKELEHRNVTSSKINRIIPIIVAMYSGYAYLITKIFDNVFNVELYKFYILLLCLSLLIITGGTTIYFMYKSTTSFENKILIPEDVNKLFVLSNECLNDHKYEEVKDNIDDTLIDGFIECAINNFDNTYTQEKNIVNLYKSIFSGFVVLFFGLIVVNTLI